MMRPMLQSSRFATPMMIASPIDAIASPLRKFEAPADVAAAAVVDPNANPLTDLPIEVAGLFAFLVLVSIAGLVKSSGALDEAAPTVGLGESREDLTDEAAEVAAMAQADKEKKYFGEIANDLAKKRGGSKKNRKKK